MSTSIPTPAEERLERGDILLFPSAPFPLPSGEHLSFLLQQRFAGFAHKNLCFNPHTHKLSGLHRTEPEQELRLSAILSAFASNVRTYLADSLPRYHRGLVADRVSFRPDEEATRRLRQNARNDLLHVDAFPSRPARGRRILRVFANLNPTDPHVWATSEPLLRLVTRYGPMARLRRGWFQEFGEGMLEFLRPVEQRRSPSDWLMLRLHDHLKANHDFQQRCSRKLWQFPPGAVWLAMTDGCTYAELRGRYVLDHSFFVAPEVLVRPDLAPAQLLAAAS